MTFVAGLRIEGNSTDAEQALKRTTGEVERLRAKTVTGAQQMVVANRAAAAAVGSLGAQFNDIGVQLAGGQSPLLIALQQGSQITQALGPLGAGGAVRALGSAFLSLLSPVNLVTLAAIAGGGALVQWLTRAGEEVPPLKDQLDGLRDATEAYGDAASALEIPIEKLIAKYGALADEVRDVQRSQAELARGDQQKALQDLLKGFGTEDLAVYSGDSIEAQFKIREDLLKRLTSGEAEYRLAVQSGNSAKMVALAAEENSIKAQLAGLRGFQSSLQEIAGDYEITISQAAGLAAATERVRDAARGSADEQVAAATALREYLVIVFGSVEAAEEKTGGLVTRLDEAALTAADVAAIDMASGIGAGADEAARLAFNLSAAAANYGALTKRTGQGGPDSARSAVQFGAVFLDGKPLVPPVVGAGRANPTVTAGRGGAGARIEADSAQALIEKLKAENDALQANDPLQKALLGYRKELATATDAERTEIEGLVVAGLQEQSVLEGIGFVAQSTGDALIDALMGGKDAGEQLIQTLIKAGLQAALLGQGPLAGLCGGGGQTTGGVGGLLGGLLGGFLKRAGGGPVYGPGTGTSDDIPAMLSNGEFVVNARAASRNRALLEAMNSGGVPGFAAGGSVGRGSAPGAFGQAVTVDVRVKVDNDGNLQAFVERVSQESAVEATQLGISMYDRMLPDRMREVSNDPRGRRA